MMSTAESTPKKSSQPTESEATRKIVEELAGHVEEKSHLGNLEAEPHSTEERASIPPTCVIVLGMAGSGKTSFVQKLTEVLSENNGRPYLVNLDPAVRTVPYPVNIDIRDTVNYKAVMERFGLGPNGGIMTSLNLFTTKFSNVLDLLEKRKTQTKYMIFDTPGQIEVFTWSASGTIITEALADVFPTVIVYVMDVSASTSPITFMSNMLYACSILYKSKLPFIVALNKIDLVDPSFALKWMTDFEAFDFAIDQDPTYAANLSRSLGLILEEFYGAIKTAPVSAVTGEGFPGFLDAVEKATEEYLREYKPELQKMKEEQAQIRREKQAARFEKLKREVAEISSGQSSRNAKETGAKKRITVGMSEEAEQEPTYDSDERAESQEAEAFQRFLDKAKKERETTLGKKHNP